MSLSTIKSGLFFYCVGLILRGDIANAAAQDLPDLATIARGIAINQDSLRNLEIKHFILKEEQRPSDTAEWEPIKQTVEGNAWYDGLPNSKVRIQITRRISEWQNGLAPWIEQQQDVGYDGQMGRVVNIRSGPPGRLSDCNTAQLLPGVPVQIHDAIQPYADGTAFCLNYFSIPDTKNRSLAKIFSDAARLGAKWPIQWETIYGVKTIKVTDGTPAYGGFLFWFDPNAGYALRKFQSEYRLPGKDWVLQREMEIPDLIEAGKGFWFPSRAICIQPYYGKFGWQIRLSYHVEKVIANNPSFDPHVFTVPFPPNYFVSDEVNGGSFYTKSAKATENAIDRAVAKLKDEDLSHLPTSTNPSAIANVPMDNIQQESVVSLTHRFPAAIAIVLAILGAAVLIFFVGVWRRFHARLRLVLMAAVLCTAGVGRAAYADEMLDPTGDVVEPNCGVYDTCFCLRWFGRAAGIRDVGRLLHSGDRLEQRCSLEEMQIAFADYNIEATGLRADNLNDILTSLKPGDLAIVRLAALEGHVDVGHFVVLARLGSNLAIIDPPGEPEILSMQRVATDKVLARTTGEFLLVTEKVPVRPASTGPVFHALSEVVNIGHIPAGINSFVGSFAYSNDGTNVLKILGTNVSCSCMQPPTGEFEVLPGKSGIIHMAFQRNRASPGLNTHFVLLRTNDPRHAAVRVEFDFDMDEAVQPMEIVIVPRQIDFGRTTFKDLVGQSPTILVKVPYKSPKLGPPAIRIETGSPLLGLEEIKSNDANDRPEGSSAGDDTGTVLVKTFEYRLKWLAAPRPGIIQESIIIRVSGQGVKNEGALEIPVRGEIMPGS